VWLKRGARKCHSSTWGGGERGGGSNTQGMAETGQESGGHDKYVRNAELKGGEGQKQVEGGGDWWLGAHKQGSQKAGTQSREKQMTQSYITWRQGVLILPDEKKKRGFTWGRQFWNRGGRNTTGVRDIKDKGQWGVWGGGWSGVAVLKVSRIEDGNGLSS